VPCLVPFGLQKNGESIPHLHERSVATDKIVSTVGNPALGASEWHEWNTSELAFWMLSVDAHCKAAAMCPCNAIHVHSHGLAMSIRCIIA